MVLMFWIGTVEPWYNEPYNKVLEQFSLPPVTAKYMKKNLDICNKTSLQETNFVSPLALRYIKVLLNLDINNGSINSKCNYCSATSGIY